MKPRAVSWFALLVLIALPVLAQQSPTQEEIDLEEEHIRSRIEHGDSHASGMRPELGPAILGNPRQAHTLIRVGLSYSFTTTGAFSEFFTRHHPFAEIRHTAGTVHLVDESTGKQIVDVEAGALVRFTRDADGYDVSVDGVFLGTFDGPVFLRPTDGTNVFRVEHIRRVFGTSQVPSYRGTLRIAHGSSTPANTLNVVNVVEIEDYVPGVVANESIASFHMEALKSQAVAARGYAIANIGRFIATFPYDIVDSSASQVYRGVISEHVRAVQASRETTGLVASRSGQIIEALYSSSMGGATENNEWIFNLPSSLLPGTNVRSYLRGIYDGNLPVAPDTTTEAGIAAFYAFAIRPDVYDDCSVVGNRFSRWRYTLTGAQLRARFTSNATVTVRDVEVVERMPSGRIAVARVTLSNGVQIVRGWDAMRTIFRPAASSAPVCGTGTVAAMVLNNPSVLTVTRAGDGSVASITILGGGWGHNVGMSQYGAHGRGRAGQSFLQILKAYYTGVDVGSYPIDIGREPGSGPPTLRQQFYTAGTGATLWVRNATMRKLRVHLNETYDIALNEEDLADGEAAVDLTGLVTPGLNTIQYNVVGHGEATVNVVVE